MRKFIWILLPVALSVLADGNNLYVQSKRAKLQAAASFKSATVATLEKGDVVQLLKTEGQWHMVNYQGKDGWIAHLLVSDKQPLQKFTLLEGEGKSLSDNARRRASSNTSTAAARGLRADDSRNRASDIGVADYRALKAMEASQVNESEITQFMSQGGLQ